MNMRQTRRSLQALRKGVPKFLIRIYEMIFPQSPNLIQRELEGSGKILDLGCGVNPSTANADYCVGVDKFKPYLQRVKYEFGDIELILADITNLQFKEKSFEAVLALSVLEHLTKEAGTQLLQKAQEWAEKKIVILVPNGFLVQSEYDDNIWQIHESEWRLYEFLSAGFQVHGIAGFKSLRGNRGQLKFRPRVFFQILSDLTQKIAYRFPKCGYELLCIKKLGKENS